MSRVCSVSCRRTPSGDLPTPGDLGQLEGAQLASKEMEGRGGNSLGEGAAGGGEGPDAKGHAAPPAREADCRGADNHAAHQSLAGEHQDPYRPFSVRSRLRGGEGQGSISIDLFSFLNCMEYESLVKWM